MSVTTVVIENDLAGQRIDNYLFKTLKGCPKSRVYRALRQGEIRVNKSRVKADYRLQAGDQIRIPPLRIAKAAEPVKPSQQLCDQIKQCILYEDERLLVVNKPAGLAVHGGSELAFGLIEVLKVMYPQTGCLELVHRLDRHTSGCLLIAKQRSALLKLHDLLLHHQIEKQYLALVKGHLDCGECVIELPLRKNAQRGGERMVVVDHEEGKPAKTIFRPIKRFQLATLVEAIPVTGRTHQIRVHAAESGFPIAGDQKYGDRAFNRQMKNCGLRRLFLHSASLSCHSQKFDQSIGICALLEDELQKVILTMPT